VGDKSRWSGFNVGDEVELVLRYNDRQETIVSLSRTK